MNRSIEFAKMGSSIALVPKLDTIELVECLAAPLQVVRITHPGVSIALSPLPNDLCARVITDELWLAENMLCLLSNAVNYSDGGAIGIDVALHTWPSLFISGSDDLRSAAQPHLSVCGDNTHGSRSLRMLRVTVTDSGIGVSPEVRAKLFQPFQQAQRMAGGSGLGLFSLSKRIAALGGRCGVDSRADGAQGSSFWFEFPYRPYTIEGADDTGANVLGALGEVSSSSGNKNEASLITLNGVDVELTAMAAHPWAMRRRSMLPPSLSPNSATVTTTMPLRILLGTVTSCCHNSNAWWLHVYF